MSRTIQIKRGLKANLPALAVGELGFTIDTHEVFIGSAAGNVPVESKESSELLVQLEADGAAMQSSITQLNNDVLAMSRGLGQSISSLALLNSTYPSGDTKDHIVAGNVKEVATLTVTAIPSFSSNVTVTLDGVAHTLLANPLIHITTAALASAIRSQVFAGWVTGGSGNVVTFESTTVGPKGLHSFSGGTSGSAGSMVTTTEGEAANYHRYFWNGTAWTDGGVYQSIEITDRGVTSDKLADYVVSPDKISADILDVDYGVNLFDITDITLGGYYAATTGAWTIEENYRSTGFIKVRPGMTVTKKGLGNQFTFWDSKFSFVSGLDTLGAHTVTVPNVSSIAYLKFPYKNTDLAVMLVEGSVYPSRYYAFREPIITVSEQLKLKSDVEVAALTKKLVGIEEVPSINLIDTSKVVAGGYYKFDTGVFTTLVNIASSGLIPAKANDNFIKNTASGQITYWDAEGNYVTGVDNFTTPTFTVPNNPDIAFVRVTMSTNFTPVSKAMLVAGSIIPAAYIPYRDLRYKVTDDFYEQLTQKNYMTPEIKEYAKVTNPILTKAIVTDRIEVKGVADPFIVFDKGRYHMFFEVVQGKNPSTLQIFDEIGHAYSDDLKNWTYTQIVISKVIHGVRAAYPNVFKYQGDWYMIPDVTANINVYKATNFPTTWEYQGYLLAGTFVDTNIFKIGETWFMTTSPLPANDIQLYYNTSRDWRNGGWKIHPNSPILIQDGVEKGKRNAGNIFYGGDYVIMPVQITPVATNVYGEYTDWYKLTNLTPTTCTVTRLDRAAQASHLADWKDDAMHHLSHVEHENGTIFAADGLNGIEYAIGLYTNI